MTVVATIGTTHPLAVAGLALDLYVARALDVRPVCVVAGVSAQDAAGVRRVDPVDAETVGAQLAAVASAAPKAVRLGVLPGAATIRTVAAGLDALGAIPLVGDPVIAPSVGRAFLDEAAIAAWRTLLLPRCTVVTPNLAEAAELTGVAVHDRAGARAAAHALVDGGAAAALVTGGHLAGDLVVDVLATRDGTTREFAAPRIGATLRGTGDLLAFALAAALARDVELIEAIESARAFVHAQIATGTLVGGTRAVS